MLSNDFAEFNSIAFIDLRLEIILDVALEWSDILNNDLIVTKARQHNYIPFGWHVTFGDKREDLSRFYRIAVVYCLRRFQMLHF